MATWIQNFLEVSNIQFENILLSKMLVTRKMILDLLPDYFTGKRKELYELAVDCWKKTSEIDPVYLKTIFPDQVYEAIQETSSSNPEIIRVLHECWQKREIAKCIYCAPVSYDNEEITSEQVIRKILEGASKILLKNRDEKYNHREAVLKLGELIVKNNDTNRDTAGFSTGLRELDKYTSGIEKGKMYAIGALKKTGKSLFSVWLSIVMRKQGASVVWDSLEMSKMQLNTVALSQYSEIDSRVLSRKLSPENMMKVQVALGELNDLDWYITREKTTAELRARLIEIQNRQSLDVVFIDYIQRMKDGDRKERPQEVEAISKDLADISRELNVAIVVLTQLSKEAERLGEGECPNMTHCKESQGIAESADCIITLHNPTRSELPYQDGEYQMPEITCLVEQRYGLSGARFKILGDLRTCHFFDHTNPYG